MSWRTALLLTPLTLTFGVAIAACSGDSEDESGGSTPTGMAGSGAGGEASMGGAATGGTTTGGGAVAVEGVAKWRYGATAAYSIIQDDALDGDPDGESYGTYGIFKHWEEGSKRGLNIAWGAIALPLNSGWPTQSPGMLRDMVAAGDEIVNHSWFHCDHTFKAPCQTWNNTIMEMDDVANVYPEMDSEDAILTQETIASREEFEKLEGVEITFYAFPLDNADDTLLQRLKDAGYLGARGGDRNSMGTVNSPDIDPATDPLTDFHVVFDGWNPELPGISRYGDLSVDPTGADSMKLYVDDAIEKGGWAVRELHGIEDMSWGQIPLDIYTAHLDYVKGLVDENQVWHDVPTEVLKYRRSRFHCGAATLADGSLTFAAASDEMCVKYHTEVSVLVSADGMPAVTQGGEALDVKDLGDGRYSIQIDPTLGAATVQ